jgi:hypothetical protein
MKSSKGSSKPSSLDISGLFDIPTLCSKLEIKLCELKLRLSELVPWVLGGSPLKRDACEGTVQQEFE